MKALDPLKKHRFVVFLAPFLKLIECVCELTVPFLVKYLIDDCLGVLEPDIGKILLIGLLMVGLAFLGFGMTMITQYLAAKTSASYAKDIRGVLFDKASTLNSSTIAKFGKNKALNLFSDDSRSIQNGVAMFMRLLGRCPFIIVGTIIASFCLNLTAGIFVASALALCSLLLFLVVYFTPRKHARIVAELDHLGELGEDGLSGNRLIKSFSLESKRVEAYKKSSDRYRKLALSLSRINALINPLSFLFVDLVVILVCYFGSYKKAETGLSIGDIVAIVSFLTTSLASLIMFARLATSISKALASIKRANEFLALKPEVEPGDKSPNLSYEGPIFEAKDIGISFGGEKKALKGVDFVLSEGECVGIYGGTGSGKSLLLNLLLRNHDIDEGVLLFKGTPIKELDFSFRSDIALCSQNKAIFSGSLRDNLKLGNPSASDLELLEALKLAKADYALRYEDGLDHQISESGANLSGGEKQRLIIARAIASGRGIIFLDDTTSALDVKTEKEVLSNILKLHKTVVVASQRPFCLKRCERIYALDGGELIGAGSFEELLKSCDAFFKAHKTQEESL